MQPSNKTLYIIGNGFDLFHGVKSLYRDFRIFLDQNNQQVLLSIEKYFQKDELWSNFEAALANLDTEKLKDGNSYDFWQYDEDSEAYRNRSSDYLESVLSKTKIITEDLKIAFGDWIKQLYIPKNQNFYFEPSSTFLNFNYTNSLEVNYGIPPDNILYIHNNISNINSIILGHARMKTGSLSGLFNSLFNDGTYSKFDEADRAIDNFFETTYKNTAKIIAENKPFFKKIRGFETVYILGHSLSAVDLKYFKRIRKEVSKNAVWTATYYNDSEKKTHFDTLTSLKIQNCNINIVRMDDLTSK